jgi:hypothetical protein
VGENSTQSALGNPRLASDDNQTATTNVGKHHTSHIAIFLSDKDTET